MYPKKYINGKELTEIMSGFTKMLEPLADRAQVAEFFLLIHFALYGELKLAKQELRQKDSVEVLLNKSLPPSASPKLKEAFLFYATELGRCSSDNTNGVLEIYKNLPEGLKDISNKIDEKRKEKVVKGF